MTSKVSTNIEAGKKPMFGRASAFHHLQTYPSVEFREVVWPISYIKFLTLSTYSYDWQSPITDDAYKAHRLLTEQTSERDCEKPVNSNSISAFALEIGSQSQNQFCAQIARRGRGLTKKEHEYGYQARSNGNTQRDRSLGKR